MLDLIATKKNVKVYTSNEKFFFDNNLSGIVQNCRKVIKKKLRLKVQMRVTVVQYNHEIVTHVLFIVFLRALLF